MNFFVTVRSVDERDINRETPFLPDEEEYEMHLSALREDFSRIAGVSIVERTGSFFRIETANAMLPTDLKRLLKSAFTPDMMMQLRVVSIAES